jgi:hypothetical protein
MRIIFIVLLTVVCSSVFGQMQGKELGLKTINKKVIQAQLEFLSSDWMEGREAGTSGNYLAGEYLSSLFKLYGLQPRGEDTEFTPNRYQKLLGAKTEKTTTCFQPFVAVEVVKSNEQSLSVVHKTSEGYRERPYQYKTDFDVVLISQSIRGLVPLVFVGYGFRNEELAYDDFKNVDVKGKIIVRISGLAGSQDSSSIAFKKISDLDVKPNDKLKNSQALEMGAVAILEFNLNESERLKWGDNAAFRFNDAMYEGDIKPTSFYDKKLRLPSDKHSLPVISITRQMLDDILADSGIDLDRTSEYGAQLKTVSQELKAKLNVNLNANTRTLKLRNILGCIEGENPNEIMIVGAHYDHLGKHNGHIFNGADDNGSGVVAVTTMAKAFMESGVKPYRTIIFALWDGEERGLLGSRSFIEHSKDLDKTLLYLNFDMIGRNGSPDSPGNKVAMIYTKAYNNLVETSKQNINDFNLNLDVNFSGVDKPVGGSDNSGFAKKEIPIFWFHTGGHTDYHKASDHVELINWDKLTDVIKLSYLNMWEFANNPKLFNKK